MLIDDLVKKQRAEKLSDTEMAEKLGCSRVHYNYIKNGKMPVNDKFRMKVYRAFPDIFLADNITNVKQGITE